MDLAKISLSLLLLFTGISFCCSQNISQDTVFIDYPIEIPSLPKGFEDRKKAISNIFETIENKKYDAAIGQANKVVTEAISNRDTVNLREAYKLLSKAYYYKGDTKQRDQYELLIQNLAIAYGYHVDEGINYLGKDNILTAQLPVVYDELQLLEDREGKLSYREISSPSLQDKYKNNFTIGSGEELYNLREQTNNQNTAPKILFNQDAVYWIKVKMVGSKTKKDNYLFHVGHFWGGSWDKVDLYIESKSNPVEHFKFGLVLSPNEKDFKYNQNYFELALEKNEVKTLYIRLEGARKGNQVGWRPSEVTLALADTRNFFEFDGYYHIPDSIDHTHDYSQPRRLNHILSALNFIEDPYQKYSLNDVLVNWNKLDPKYPYQLIGQKPSEYYWAKLNLVNKAKNANIHSFMLPELWDDVEVYVPDSNYNYKKIITGSNLQDDKKSVPGLYNIFRINAYYNDTLTIYIKFKSNNLFPYSSTNLTKFEIVHFDESQLWYNHYKQYLPHFIMIGILSIQMLYYLIIFLINKERTHLYLMFFFFGIFLSTLNVSNIISQFQSNRAVLFLGWSISILGLFKYTETILNIKKISNWVYKINRGIFYILLVALVTLIGSLSYNYFFKPVIASDDDSVILTIILPIILFVLIALFIQAIYAVIKRIKYANIFLIFYILTVVSILTPSFSILGFVGLSQDQTTVLFYALFTLSTLGLILITAYRLKQLRKDQEEKEKAQASERAKHQFLANMSHEIRTPMNAIKGMTDILIRRNPKDDQIEYLESIKQSSDSLLVIINDILDIAKIEAGKIELENKAFSVNNLLENVHTVMQFKAEEKGLVLKKEIPTEHLYVRGDATRLRQILINLIGNAIKFTEKGHVITIIKSKKVNEKVQLHFTIADTGIGIDKDHLDKIFKSFEQAYSDTSRKFGGTGLGLSISKMLVELHNGKIWVESEKGKGSQFHFTIVYERDEIILENIKDEATHANVAEDLKGIKILLVEDNQFNAIVAQEELEDAIEDVEIAVAENGAIAVEKINLSEFDIVLMDIQMPIMNGYDATKAIRSLSNAKASIPIIAMTANVLKDEVELCYQAGMNDFIGKPFDLKELLQKMHNLKTKTHD